MMAHKHKLIIALAVAVILMLAACVNENLDILPETTPAVSGTKDPVASETDAQTQDPSETTGDDGGFWLPPDEF